MHMYVPVGLFQLVCVEQAPELIMYALNFTGVVNCILLNFSVNWWFSETLILNCGGFL